METKTPLVNGDPTWLHLASGLPDTKAQMGLEIIKGLRSNGYVYLERPISLENYQVIAGQVGPIISQSNVRVDETLKQAQEKNRLVKGQPGRYQASAFSFHTDNVRVAVASFYCVEQDAVDGAMLLLDTSDIAEYFSNREIEVLTRVNLCAPDLESAVGQDDSSKVAPLLSRTGDSYLVYYVPWMFRDSYDIHSSEMLKKFADYVKHKEETDLIRLPVRAGECVFIDNHRMLHGRAAIAADSQRHLIRLYLEAPAFARGSRVVDDVS